MADIFGNELTSDRTMFVVDQEQAKLLVQVNHPGCFVQCLKSSKGLVEVKVYEKEGDDLAISSYAAKIW